MHSNGRSLASQSTPLASRGGRENEVVENGPEKDERLCSRGGGGEYLSSLMGVGKGQGSRLSH